MRAGRAATVRTTLTYLGGRMRLFMYAPAGGAGRSKNICIAVTRWRLICRVRPRLSQCHHATVNASVPLVGLIVRANAH